MRWWTRGRMCQGPGCMAGKRGLKNRKSCFSVAPCSWLAPSESPSASSCASHSICSHGFQVFVLSMHAQPLLGWQESLPRLNTSASVEDWLLFGFLTSVLVQFWGGLRSDEVLAWPEVALLMCCSCFAPGRS